VRADEASGATYFPQTLGLELPAVTLRTLTAEPRDKIFFDRRIPMDSHLSVDQAASEGAEVTHPMTTAEEALGMVVPALASVHPGFCSPGETAQRELQACLELLADRMQYITGASAATIALNEGQEMLCRASAGPMATALGTQLRVDSTLVNQGIRQRQIICCNDAANGACADGTSYGTLGIKSIMVMPLLRESEAVGMFELLADRPQAFDDRDGAALERLAGMVLIALEHSDAAKRVFSDIAPAGPSTSEEPEVPAGVASAEKPAVTASAAQPDGPKAAAKLRACEACGFPVSEGRTICLDCEEARAVEDSSGAAPAFLSELVREQQRGWLQSHFYTIGTLLMVALTVVVLMLKFR